MIKGILFDKDGTLLDFDALWGSASYGVMPMFLQMNNIVITQHLVNRMLESTSDAISWMTYDEIGEILTKVLREEGVLVDTADVGKQLEELYFHSVSAPGAVINPLGDYERLFPWLQDKDIVMGVATADSRKTTEYCLERLGIKEYFSYIGTSDDVERPKPAPDMFKSFQRKYGLKSDEIMVVGDNVSDMKFARDGGGIAVAVLSGTGNKLELEETADYVIDTVENLIDILGEKEHDDVRVSIKACI